jgi:hypothetical protein
VQRYSKAVLLFDLVPGALPLFGRWYRVRPVVVKFTLRRSRQPVFLRHLAQAK